MAKMILKGVKIMKVDEVIILDDEPVVNVLGEPNPVEEGRILVIAEPTQAVEGRELLSLPEHGSELNEFETDDFHTALEKLFKSL